LKTYNKTNFFKHTFCEFKQIDDFDFPEDTNYKSKSESMYFIEVDFEEKTAKIQPKKENTTNYLFSFSEAQKRIKQITHLFTNDKWAKYFDEEIEIIRKNIISEFINSDKTLQDIKLSLK